MKTPDPTSDSTPSTQRGAALLIFLAIFILVASMTFLKMRPNKTVTQQTNEYSSDNLAKAKEALLSYVIVNGYNTGELGRFPCPDTNDYEGNADGQADAAVGGQCNTLVGRIPYATIQLDTRDATDGNGNLLWYGISQNFTKNDVNADSSPLLDNTGQEEIVAAIFSPGVARDGQSRSNQTEMTAYANYLEQVEEVSGVPKFPVASPPSDANDRWVTVSRKEIIELIQNYLIKLGKECLSAYATSSGGKFPWAAPMSDVTDFKGVCGQYAGRFPFGGVDRLLPPGCADAAAGGSCEELLEEVQGSCDNLTGNDCAEDMVALAPCDILDATCNLEVTVDNPDCTGYNRSHGLCQATLTMNIVDISNYFLTQPPCTTGGGDICNNVNTVLSICGGGGGGGDGRDAQMQETMTGTACATFREKAANWKTQVIYHVSEGYAPGGADKTSNGTPNCTVSSTNRCFTYNSGAQDVPLVVGMSNVPLTGQSRDTVADQAEISNYLEGDNLSSFSTTPSGGNYTTIPKTVESDSFNDVMVCPSGTGC